MMQTSLLRRLLPVAVLLTSVLTAAPLRAQMIESREGIALRDQIAELRHELQMLQDQVSRGGGGSSLGTTYRAPPSSGSGNDLVAQLLVRVDQLEDQTRQLRGRIDELQNQLQRQTDDLGKRIDDLAFQVQNPQAAAAAAAAARQTAAASPAPLSGVPAGAPPSPQTGVLGTLPAPRTPGAPPAAPRPPELAMQEGSAALARRDYPTAEAAAREVLANRTSPRAYDAMFLLAQAQYGQRQYSQAALSYDDAYNRARKGSRAEDSLLGLADSLIGLGDKTSACQALGKLHAEFPTVRPDLREPIIAAHARAGCR
jgi:TolA-binding protein